MGKIIGLVLVVLVLLGGFMFWKKQQSDSAALDTTGPAMVAEKAPENGMVASIKDAMGLGQKMQCTYAMGEGDQAVTSTVFVDGEKYKSTTVTGGMTVSSVFDGESQYSWTSGTKTGMKLSKECMEKMQKSVEGMAQPTGTPAPNQAEDMQAAFDMAKNVQCEAAAGADFSLPTDVTFTDQCAMMEQSMKMMEEMKDKMPAGMTIPTTPK